MVSLFSLSGRSHAKIKLLLPKNKYVVVNKTKKSHFSKMYKNIFKNKLGSAQVPKFSRLLVKIDSSASIP